MTEIKSHKLKKRFEIKEYEWLYEAGMYPLALAGKTLTQNGVECLVIGSARSESMSCGMERLITLDIHRLPVAPAQITAKCAGSIESMIADGWEQEVEFGRRDAQVRITASCDGFARSLNGLADLFDQRTPLMGAGGTVAISQPDDEPKQRYTLQPKRSYLNLLIRGGIIGTVGATLYLHHLHTVIGPLIFAITATWMLNLGSYFLCRAIFRRSPT